MNKCRDANPQIGGDGSWTSQATKGRALNDQFLSLYIVFLIFWIMPKLTPVTREIWRMPAPVEHKFSKIVLRCCFSSTVNSLGLSMLYDSFNIQRRFSSLTCKSRHRLLTIWLQKYTIIPHLPNFQPKIWSFRTVPADPWERFQPANWAIGQIFYRVMSP